jgi:hypothetical protein
MPTAFKPGEKLLGVVLPGDLIRRIRLEAARTDTTIRRVVMTTLDKGLPQSIRIVVKKDKPAE